MACAARLLARNRSGDAESGRNPGGRRKPQPRRSGSMAELAEPQEAGEGADVRIGLVQLAHLIAGDELLDGEADATPHLALEELLVLALVKLEHGGSGW